MTHTGRRPDRQADARAASRDALRLRRWALRVLAAPVADTPAPTPAADAAPATSTPPPAPRGVSPLGWRTFLCTERCALPLSRRLRSIDDATRPPSDDAPHQAAGVLHALALEETQRALSAKAQLRALSRWADEHGATVVLLKGAVAATDDARALDLADIDVWVAPDARPALIEALDRSGHTPMSHGAAHHPAARLADQLVAVEVHDRVPHAGLDADWITRVRPLGPDFPGLARLDAADHLWHVLVHAAIQHIERRGRLRDLLLIAHARSICSMEERKEVLERARRHADATPLLAMLHMAARIGSGPVPADPFTRFAAGRYLHAFVQPPAAIGFLFPPAATAAALHGPRACLRYLADARHEGGRLSNVAVLRALELRSRRLGGAVVLGIRVAKRAAALALAAHRALTAHRLATP